MNPETQPLALHRSSARDFLYCKPDARRPPRTAVFPDPQFCARLDGVGDLLVGSAFITHATTLVEPLVNFATVVVRIDGSAQAPGEPDGDPARGSASHRAVAASLSRMEDYAGALWGWLDWDLFGWILPGIDGAQALDRIAVLRQSVAEQVNDTISAGVAVYPCLSFSKSQILENARKALDQAAFFGPGQSALFDDVTLNISGDQRYQHGDINGAMEEFKKALALNPDNVNVHNSLGVCYGVVGAYDTALRCFADALERAPKDLMALYNAGLVHWILGDRTHALSSLLSAAEAGEPVFEVTFQTGRLYMEGDQPAEARPFLESAVRLQPEAGAAWRLLGECFHRLDAVSEAVAAYKRAVKLNPSDAESLSALGCLFDRQGENPEITTIFCEQAVDIAPQNGLFHHRLGALYLKQERYDEALRAFRRAQDLGCDARTEIDAIVNLGMTPSPKVQ
jgi:tetratricopeptide (TPR) repeat protein